MFLCPRIFGNGHQKRDSHVEKIELENAKCFRKRFPLLQGGQKDDGIPRKKRRLLLKPLHNFIRCHLPRLRSIHVFFPSFFSPWSICSKKLICFCVCTEELTCALNVPIWSFNPCISLVWSDSICAIFAWSAWTCV